MTASELMNFEVAVGLIKNAVKHCHLANQPHVDLTLVSADKRQELQNALMAVRAAIIKGEKTEDEVKTILGLIP